jgi:hypothetical protein
MTLDQKFARLVDRLHPSLEKLRDGPAFKGGNSPKQGVYLFCENGVPFYVGRSNNIPKRYTAHLSGRENQAAFAFILACKAFGRSKASYRKENSRRELMKDPTFLRHFDAARQRNRSMEFRAVEETDQTCQTLLEVYCAVVLETPHNDFGTH